MPKAGAPIVVRIPFERTTAGGQHLFNARGTRQAVQNIYVRGDSFEKPQPPKSVKVTVEYEYDE